MTGSSLRAVLASVLALAAASAGAETLVYRESTAGTAITTIMSENRSLSGATLHSRMSDGDRHDVVMDAATATLSYHVASPRRQLDYTVVRQGATLFFQGTLAGKPFAKTTKIDARPWYQSPEMSFSDLVRDGGTEPVIFWIVYPWEGRAYLMQVRREARELVPVNGVATDTVRMKVTPAGILSLFWSAWYWYGPVDGRFLRYRAARGVPGTPDTIVELLGPS
jgi:hypothetical protein